MKMTTGIALLSAAALLGPVAANAAETLPWTYAEFGYNRTDGSDIEGDGKAETSAYDLTAGVGFLGKWHAALTWNDGETDLDASDDVDFDGYRLVVGAHPQIGDRTQLITELTYFDYGADAADLDVDVDGYGLGFGLRHAFTAKLEGSIRAWYIEGDTDVSEFGNSESLDFNETIIEIQGRYNWTKNLSTGLTASIGGAFNTLGAATSWAPVINGSGIDDGEKTGLGDGGETIRFDVRWAFGNNDLWDLM